MHMKHACLKPNCIILGESSPPFFSLSLIHSSFYAVAYELLFLLNLQLTVHAVSPNSSDTGGVVACRQDELN